MLDLSVMKNTTRDNPCRFNRSVIGVVINFFNKIDSCVLTDKSEKVIAETNKVITKIVIRLLDNPARCAQSVAADLRPSVWST